MRRTAIIINNYYEIYQFLGLLFGQVEVIHFVQILVLENVEQFLVLDIVRELRRLAHFSQLAQLLFL